VGFVVDIVALGQFVSGRLFSLPVMFRVQLSSVTGTVGPLEAYVQQTTVSPEERLPVS
jgi:hypothetical protein